MRERSKRQSFLGEESDATFANAHVAIVGLGGGGSHVAQQLVHVGVGRFTLLDPDTSSEVNLNRQVGTTAEDTRLGLWKVDSAERLIKGVNPEASVRAIRARWQDEATALRDADVIVGCLDSFGARFQLEGAARRFLTPYVDLGMDVHEIEGQFAVAGQVALSLPGHLCLQCMAVIREDDLAREQYGAAGGRPQIVWCNGLLASAAVGLIVELLTPWFFPAPHSVLLNYEGNAQELRRHPWVAAHGAESCRHYPLSQTGDPFFSVLA
jgi:hypothetical protein